MLDDWCKIKQFTEYKVTVFRCMNRLRAHERDEADTVDQYDVLVIGGGVNGCGIARDATGRGLQVALVEQGDLASATSSASTKLFHGGLRYLEHYEFGLVRKALIEREVLLRNMPHISWPMRFVIPHLPGMRPRWMVRAGLFLYDYIGGRKALSRTKRVNFRKSPLGVPLIDDLKIGFEYSDCWVDDARLVVLNARDAADRGAHIMTRTRFVSAKSVNGRWVAVLRDTRTGKTKRVRTRVLVNAAGPWVKDVIENRIKTETDENIRLVRGSHIVVPKTYDHDRAYFFQNSDGRLIFTIPYEMDFTLIGTTDVDHDQAISKVKCSAEEATYLCEAVSRYFKSPITPKDIVWHYAGVRPLHDMEKGMASAASRDYQIKVRRIEGESPLINVFGGKITTYRKLAEEVVAELAAFTDMINKPWTYHAHLPGGDFALRQKETVFMQFKVDFPFLSEDLAARLFKTYGTCAALMLKGITSIKQMGQNFGADLTEIEVRWLMRWEWAETAEDILWRRTKLGLRMTKDESVKLENWMQKAQS